MKASHTESHTIKKYLEGNLINQFGYFYNIDYMEPYRESICSGATTGVAGLAAYY